MPWAYGINEVRRLELLMAILCTAKLVRLGGLYPTLPKAMLLDGSKKIRKELLHLLPLLAEPQ